MKTIVIFGLTAILSLVASQPAQAILITRVAANDALGGAVTVNSVVISAALKTIAIDVDILKAGTLFSLGFNAATEGAIFPEFSTYAVTVTMKNMITPFNTALGFAMNGFDVDVVDPGGNPILGITGPFASDKFAVVMPNIPSGFRFGGLNGGGGEIYFGQTAISSFSLGAVSFAAANQNFGLTFVANPEPTTLLLGGLAMIPAAVAARRRRKLALETAV